MKVIIDRDSVCMGDDFCHQLTIECSDDETIESIMNKILKSKFFPVENLNHIVKKWNTIINNEIILNFYPTENRIEYLIDKNYNIANLENLNIYFKATNEDGTVLLGKFISNINENWRNSIYITCSVCKYKKENCCDDILLSFDADGNPTFIAVTDANYIFSIIVVIFSFLLTSITLLSTSGAG